MSDRGDDELFVVKRWHLCVVVGPVVRFIGGMTARSLLLSTLRYYVFISGATDTSASNSPLSLPVSDRRAVGASGASTLQVCPLGSRWAG